MRWETELKSVEVQLADHEKKIRDELKVEPNELPKKVIALESEAAALVKEIDELLGAKT